jgi:NAD(P)-dependent dehydrogenase (short-subunit alcohol dehydrogenase family)
VEIRGRTFLITGGGSGLGAATARTIAAAGGKVLILDVNAKAGESVAKELADHARFVQADVADTEQVQRAIRVAQESLGGLDGTVNCAGIGAAQKTVHKDGPHDLGIFERILRVNLIGTFNVIRLTAAAMVKNEPTADGERGVIVNTASVAAFDGQIGQAAYSASKGGIVGMTLPIARDLAREGIRVVTIAPGLFDTPLMAGLPEPARKALEASVPFPSRLGKPGEYAALAKHIIENPMLNGEVIRLDGAIRMAPR